MYNIYHLAWTCMIYCLTLYTRIIHMAETSESHTYTYTIHVYICNTLYYIKFNAYTRAALCEGAESITTLSLSAVATLSIIIYTIPSCAPLLPCIYIYVCMGVPPPPPPPPLTMRNLFPFDITTLCGPWFSSAYNTIREDRERGWVSERVCVWEREREISAYDDNTCTE